jgi:ankyrin repeat protein
MRQKLRTTLAFALAASLALSAYAHEADQYSVPAGREFADLRLFFSEEFHGALQSAVSSTNARIKRSLRNGQATGQTASLQSPEVIARAMLSEFPPVANYIELLELALRTPKVRARYPGLVIAHQPAVWIYHHWALLLDPTKLVRLWRSSTIMVDGTYFGTDKLAHFTHMGHIYYSAYRQARAAGQDEAAANRRAVSLGAGAHPFFSENALLGLVSTGVRSNADLAANYAGLKFYRNLIEPVRVRGELRPPLLVRDGPYWRLNDHVRVNSDFFTVFTTDHWDEALNPNTYVPGMGIWLRYEVRKRCDDVLNWYRDRHGRRRTKAEFTRIAEDLRTYYGEDYGHAGEFEKMVTIANCCFDDQEPSGTVVTQNSSRSAVTARAHVRRSSSASPPGGGGTGEREQPLNVKLADRHGRTAVWWAAADGDTDVLRRLIAQGGDVNAADLDRETPLHCAARWGRTPAVEVLLQAGAEVNARTVYGATPLHLAVRESQIEVVSMLLARGADASARDAFGCTALHDAAAKGEEKSVALLLHAGASPSAGDGFGTTPLHRAARAGHAEVVALLSKKDGDATATNAFGRTALDEAVFSGHGPTLRSLTQQRRAAAASGWPVSSDAGKRLQSNHAPRSGGPGAPAAPKSKGPGSPAAKPGRPVHDAGD